MANDHVFYSQVLSWLSYGIRDIVIGTRQAEDSHPRSATS